MAWLIFYVVFFDKVDGVIVCWFEVSSEFGVQFDFFFDFVIFGICFVVLVIQVVVLGVLESWFCGVFYAVFFGFGVFYVFMVVIWFVKFNVIIVSVGICFFFWFVVY